MEFSRYNQSGLIVPPREEEEAYPYRRVWPSIILETGLVFSVTLIVFITYNFIGVRFPDSIARLVNIGIAVFPAIIWTIISLWRETRAVEPRTGLAISFVISVLAAYFARYTVIVPLAPESYLSLVGSIERILGYAFTVGAVQEGTKYLILRYVTRVNDQRIRSDSLAYAVPIAIGHVVTMMLTMPNLSIISSDVLAAQMFHTYSLHLIGGLIVAYGIAALRFDGRSLLVLPISVLLATVFNGFVSSVRTEFLNAGFTLGLTAPRLLIGFLFTLGIVIGGLSIILFVTNAAERREQEMRITNELQL